MSALERNFLGVRADRVPSLLSGLVVALAGVGLSTDVHAFRGLGIKPFLVGFGAAVAVGVISYVVISLLGSFVSV
jgi:uncharacterized membrane protein YadS